MLTGALLVVILMLTTVAIVLWYRSSGTTSIVSPPAVTGPDLPPVQPQPPLPPDAPEGTKINPEFIYPGAQKTMELADAQEGNMIQLQTSDSLDKVVKWYTEKLRPTSVIKQANEHSQSVVLATKEMAAIINANDAGTTIMLTAGDH